MIAAIALLSNKALCPRFFHAEYRSERSNGKNRAEVQAPISSLRLPALPGPAFAQRLGIFNSQKHDESVLP